VEANFTLPKKFLEDTKVSFTDLDSPKTCFSQSFGIALSIGERAAQWNLKFLIEVGTSLAKQGQSHRSVLSTSSCDQATWLFAF